MSYSSPYFLRKARKVDNPKPFVFETGIHQLFHVSPFRIQPKSSVPLHAFGSLFYIIFAFLALPVRAIPIDVSKSSSPTCLQATWEQIVVFILTNYVTHAMTVNSYAGEKANSAVFFSIVSLLLPFAGAMRGLGSIGSGAIFAKDSLRRCPRADALCVVARSEDWLPQGQEKVHGCTIEGIKPANGNFKAHVVVKAVEGKTINLGASQIHGQFLLPAGYHLSLLPSCSLVTKEPDLPIEISSSYSFSKIIASMVQLVAAIITLYRARGTQLEQYGYAAFGLSVIQYAIMSFINLLGNLICPVYPTLYMLRSEVMDEAEARGGRFIGAVGMLVQEVPEGTQGETLAGSETVRFNVDSKDGESKLFGYENQESFHYSEEGATTITVPSLGRCVTYEFRSERWSTIFGWTLLVMTVLGPYIIIAALTKFKAQKSTSIQRGFMMSWLVVGQVG